MVKLSIFAAMILIWFVRGKNCTNNDETETTSNHLLFMLTPNSIFKNVDIVGSEIRTPVFERHESALVGRKDIRSHGRSASCKPHKIIIAVKQSNLDVLKKLVDDISDPDSENFGAVRTREQINAITNHHDSSNYIIQYLAHLWQGNTEVQFDKSVFGEYISVTAPVILLESFLAATFEEYWQVIDDSAEPHIFHRAKEYSLPRELAHHIHTVFLLIDIPPAVVTQSKTTHTTTSSATTSSSTSTGYVTPSVLNSYYSITSNTGSASVSQVVYASVGQSLSPSDLSAFQTKFGIPSQPVNADIGGHVSNNACAANVDNCAEANLDVQYLMGLSQVSPTTFFYWNSTSDPWEGFLVSLANHRESSTTTPTVISISYGAVENQISTAYLHSFDVEALKLAAQGVTIVASSGDDGVNCAAGLCGASTAVCGYYPTFPASSPYVTAGPESNNPEVACQSNTNGGITTGGGFSASYRMPSWQESAIQKYLNSTTGLSAVSGFNAAGRGYPDVSLLGNKYLVILNNSLYPVSGTSASAPAFAAMVSLVNAARYATGKGGLGWINPTIYKYSSQFVNDVSSGNNKCVKSGSCCSSGFTATAGWDPVTGWGSINFPSFKSLLTSLGNQLNVPTLSPSPVPGTTPTAGTPRPSSTALPTISNSGWMYKYTYAQKNCVGSVANVLAVPLGVCLRNYRISGVTMDNSGYQMYSCNNGVPSVSYFYNNGCTFANSNFNTTISFTSGCSYVTDTEYYDMDSQSYSASLQCTSAATYQSIIPASTAAYAVNTLYNDGGCKTVSAVQAFKQDTCVDLTDAFNGNMNGQQKSYSIALPHVYAYKYTKCSPQSYTEYTITSGQCNTPFGYVTGTTELSQSWTSFTTPTAAPTFQSTSAPTSYAAIPTLRPSSTLTVSPRSSPSTSTSAAPLTNIPSTAPTLVPSLAPTALPLSVPPTFQLTYPPSSVNPSVFPTVLPTTVAPTPSSVPSKSPHSTVPSVLPTIGPSTVSPTQLPTSPTKAPSDTPSSYPTLSVRGNASFVVQQTVNGVGAGFKDSLVRVVSVFVGEVAYILNVTSSSVQVLGVFEVSSSSSKTAANMRVTVDATRTVDILVTYKVVVQHTVLPADAYTAVLAVSVSSGQFTQLLQVKAKQLNITVLEGASSSFYSIVTNAPSGTPTRYPTDNSSSSGLLGLGGIVGIVIGGAVLLLCVITCFYYFFCGNNGIKCAPASDNTSSANMRPRSLIDDSSSTKLEGDGASAEVVERNPSLVDL